MVLNDQLYLSGLNVLTFGWELPPFNSGGLGVACLGLSKALSDLDVNITFVLPKKLDLKFNHLNLIFADNSLTSKDASLLLSGYITEELYSKLRSKYGLHNFNSDLFNQVLSYAEKASKIAKDYPHNLIHGHDWLTFPAAINAKKVSNKPLVLHVHATEFDRCGGMNINEKVYQIERKGMEEADKVIAVSNYTKNMIQKFYGIDEGKIEVVHNGIETDDVVQTDKSTSNLSPLKTEGNKVVLFVGRITLQKGLDYFLKAASQVLKFNPKTIFIVAGGGDMQNQMINMASSLGISKNVFFTGFLRGDDLDEIYNAADLFVMPSVSEPFGISALEALKHHTPVIISKQSGVSEALTHALKVDFWDTDEMTNKILSVLNHKSLFTTLSLNGYKDATKMSWVKSAKKCLEIYRSLT